jgi:protein involved in polysaccharide export with SLBB domain
LQERALLDRIDERGFYKSADFALDRVMSGQVLDPALEPRDHLRIFSIWDVRERYQVSISGEVRRPGQFDYREGMTLRDLVLSAGGLKDGADVFNAEISRLEIASVTARDHELPPTSTVELLRVELGENWLEVSEGFLLEPHDRVAIRRLPWWQLPRTVTVRGEVSYPGVYTLDSPSERLSTIINRAGGLKPTAYAPGARIVRTKDQMGNIALKLDKALDEPGSQYDAILEAGDEILVPQQQTTVKITGAVGFPTSVVFEDGFSISDYVKRAGGYADRSDKRKTHVIYPNGMSGQVRRIWRDPAVKPGSTIVVPYKQPQEGATKLQTMREITAILASLAMVWLVVDNTTR